ncbi:MAG: hypothetical protein JXA20_17970 [Spirochaetes bacterium]|nr:hypothetical protein [Spirochaetota bacterium]
MKYLGIVLCINLVVIAYVWQNIEVMKMRIQLKETRRAHQGMMQEHDLLRYEIEKRRTMRSVGEYADAHGLRQWTPGDIRVIVVPGQKAAGSK